ncbi:hypothetical protein JCM3765_002867 [Sporobolomyces pararoseus]
MSRDRLREARNQQQGYQQQPPQQQWSDQLQPTSYGQPQSSYGGGGYGGYSQPQQQYAPPPPQQQQQPQQYYQQDPYSQPAPPVNNSYQMQPMNTSGVPQPGGDLSPFFAEVESIQDEIKQLQGNITSVSDLHSRRLASTGDDQLQAQTASQLTQLTNQTSGLTNSIRNRITKLNDQNKRSVQGDPNFNTRKLQIANLQNSFKRSLEEYNLVEKRSRDKYRQRMERQIKIVKPDATQEEIRAAYGDSQGGAQIFSQALMQSRASGARAAFAEVQSRNQDLRKIEETITQLAQMMQDMATLVLEQDESVKMIETQAVQVNTDVEQGLDQTKKAVKSARAARRKRWICFFIILIIIIIAVVIGVYYGLDYLPVARMVGAGVLVRDRWDTVSFVFKDEEDSKLAYKEFESGEPRRLLRQHAQWDLYVAVRPVAKVAFTMVEPIEELVQDETRRIYVEEEYKPEPQPSPQSELQTQFPPPPPHSHSHEHHHHHQHGRNHSTGTSLGGSVGDIDFSDGQSGSYFDSRAASAGSGSASSSRPPVMCRTCRRLFFPFSSA